MKHIIRFLAVMAVMASAAQGAEPVTTQFLRYIYGGEGIEFTNICHPSDDAWMLRGVKNTNALAALDRLKFSSKSDGVVSGVFGTDLYFIELRDGKVDPAFNLDGVQILHRQLIGRFLYSALSREDSMLGRLTTDVSHLKIVGPKAARGDMSQYSSVIELMPIVRSSKPADDAKTRSVTYRLPLGNEALSLTLVKDGNAWRIDTSKNVRVPLEFFFR